MELTIATRPHARALRFITFSKDTRPSCGSNSRCCSIKTRCVFGLDKGAYRVEHRPDARHFTVIRIYQSIDHSHSTLSKGHPLT